jgi:DNA repair protein RadC
MNSNSGHRARLREKFLSGGLSGFLDYEIVELLLTLGTPRRDCKQIAKLAIKRFSNLEGVLNAPIESLQQIKGLGPSNVFGLKLFQAISEIYNQQLIPHKIKVDSPQKLADFLMVKIGNKKKEYFTVICLDSRNTIIKIIDGLFIGTLTTSIVHPREVFKEALDCSAASIIIAHNHPSGDTSPSDQDIAITKKLLEVGKIMGIEVLDHIIVSSKQYTSFKQSELL